MGVDVFAAFVISAMIPRKTSNLDGKLISIQKLGRKHPGETLDRSETHFALSLAFIAAFISLRTLTRMGGAVEVGVTCAE